MERLPQNVASSSPEDPFSVLLADNHLIVRIGLKKIIQKISPAILVDEVAGVESVVSKLNSGVYQLLILDINMRHGESFSLVSHIRSKFPEVRVLIFTSTNELVFATRFLQLGVYGYLLKQSDETEILAALTAVIAGEKYVSDALARLIAGYTLGNRPNPFESLTNREFEVVLQLLQGYSAGDIAGILHMNKSTAATHKSRIMRKLKVATLVALIDLAREFGLIGT